jgi:ligand-binding sensor domain-containing protein
MGEDTSEGTGREPAIHEVSIEEGGAPRSLETVAPASRPWLIAIVAATAIAALAYGFMLGRGDRPGAPTSSAPGSPTTSTSTATSLNPNPYPEGLEGFIRAAPGHALGRGVTEYLNPNLYEALTIDTDGTIWAGGPSGVVRLDPTSGEFTKLTDTDGTGPLDITALATAPSGEVWAASPRGLSQWDGEAWTHASRYPRSYPEDLWVAGLEIGAEGDVWLATNAWTPQEYSASVVRVHRLREPYAGDMPAFSMGSAVTAMSLVDNTLYLVSGANLWQYDGEWHPATGLQPAQFHSMAIDGTGTVWLAGENRIVRWNGSTQVDVPWGAASGPDDETDPGYPESWVQALVRGVDADIWALTRWFDSLTNTTGAALIHFDGDAYTRIAVPESSHAWSQALAVAPNGAVWVANEDRLLRFDGEWRSYSMEGPPPLGWPDSMAIGPAGELWMAYYDGILEKNGDEWRWFGPGDFGRGSDDEPAGGFWVTSGADGSTWAGEGCRAHQLVDSEWLALPAPLNVPDPCFGVSVFADSGGSLWMSPSLSAVYRWSGTEWHRVTGTRSLADFAVGDDGGVWIVNPQGVNRVIDGETELVLEGVPVGEIAVSGTGEVWVAGGRWDSAAGLWHFDGNTWSFRQDGSYQSLTSGPDGHVWALDTRSDGETELIDLETGLVRRIVASGGSSAMAIAPDGTVWIGGEGRLYRVDPLY